MRKDEFTKMKKDKAITSFLQWCIGDGFGLGASKLGYFQQAVPLNIFLSFCKIRMQDNQYTLLVLVCLSFFSFYSDCRVYFKLLSENSYKIIHF